MRTPVAALILMTAVCFVPAGAEALTSLGSAPLTAGAGGLVCSCTNLTADTIVVHFAILSANGGSGCGDQRILGGGSTSQPCRVTGGTTTFVSACNVRRDDEKPASPKDLACSLATLDGAGNVTAVVPLDKKVRN